MSSNNGKFVDDKASISASMKKTGLAGRLKAAFIDRMKKLQKR